MSDCHRCGDPAPMGLHVCIEPHIKREAEMLRKARQAMTEPRFKVGDWVTTPNYPAGPGKRSKPERIVRVGFDGGVQTNNSGIWEESDLEPAEPSVSLKIEDGHLHRGECIHCGATYCGLCDGHVCPLTGWEYRIHATTDGSKCGES